MKTTIVALIGISIAINSFGQGQFSFQNANVSAQRITTNALAVGGTSGSMAGASNYQFQVFYGPNSASMTNASQVFFNGSTAGLISGGTITLAAGYPALSPVGALQAFGWSTGLTLAQAQSTPGAFWGSSTIISPTPADPLAPLFNLFTSTASSTQFSGFVLNVVAVPEPSTMVLAGLGTASLLLFRRRKQA
jgi:hypothetical protein